MAIRAGETAATAGAGAAGAVAWAAGIVAAALVRAKGRAAARTVLGPSTTSAATSEGGALALTGFDRRTWGRNRSPPLVLTMFPTKEREKGWREKLDKMETGN